MMQSQEEIVTAAIRSLNADPTLSMGRLAESIGVSRATLHRHFATRDALMHALGRRALQSWADSQDHSGMDEAGTSGDPARIAAALETLMRRFVADAEEHGFALTAHSLAAFTDLIGWSDRLERREIAFYTAAQRAGVIRPDLPPAWVANHVYGLLVAARESLRQGSVARREIEDLVLTTLRHGIAAPTTPPAATAARPAGAAAGPAGAAAGPAGVAAGPAGVAAGLGGTAGGPAGAAGGLGGVAALDAQHRPARRRGAEHVEKDGLSEVVEEGDRGPGGIAAGPGGAAGGLGGTAAGPAGDAAGGPPGAAGGPGGSAARPAGPAVPGGAAGAAAASVPAYSAGPAAAPADSLGSAVGSAAAPVGTGESAGPAASTGGGRAAHRPGGSP